MKKETIELVKKMVEDGNLSQEIAEKYCPELKESKDERIKKWLICTLKSLNNSPVQIDGAYEMMLPAIAWLEKQGRLMKALQISNARIGELIEENYYLKEQFEKQGADISLFSNEQQKYMEKYISLDKVTLIKLLAERDRNVEETTKSFEKQNKNNIGISEATKQELEDNLNNALEKETPESLNEFLDEQNLVNKVEPKFKVEKDKWYVCTSQYCNCIEGRNYKASLDGRIIDDYGTEYDMHSDAYRWFRPWTIQDAKNGDVLATLDYILVFKEFLKNDGGISYCHYDFGAGNPQFIWLEDKNWYFGKEAIIHPATKEQRDLLFQKMHEAGYEWDAKKKELKKIEQNPANVFNIYEKPLLEKFKQAAYDCAWGKVTCKTEGETQEEYAERWAEQFLLMVRDWADDYIDFTIQQKLRKSYDKGKENAIKENRSSWSEEDERIRIETIELLETANHPNKMHSNGKPLDFTENINWLKSLRPQKLLTNEEIEQAKKEYRDVALSKMDYIPEELTYDDGWDDAISYIEKVFKTLYLGSLINENG